MKKIRFIEISDYVLLTVTLIFLLLNYNSYYDFISGIGGFSSAESSLLFLIPFMFYLTCVISLYKTRELRLEIVKSLVKIWKGERK